MEIPKINTNFELQGYKSVKCTGDIDNDIENFAKINNISTKEAEEILSLKYDLVNSDKDEEPELTLSDGANIDDLLISFGNAPQKTAAAKETNNNNNNTNGNKEDNTDDDVTGVAINETTKMILGKGFTSVKNALNIPNVAYKASSTYYAVGKLYSYISDIDFSAYGNDVAEKVANQLEALKTSATGLKDAYRRGENALIAAFQNVVENTGTLYNMLEDVFNTPVANDNADDDKVDDDKTGDDKTDDDNVDKNNNKSTNKNTNDTTNNTNVKEIKQISETTKNLIKQAVKNLKSVMNAPAANSVEKMKKIYTATIQLCEITQNIQMASFGDTQITLKQELSEVFDAANNLKEALNANNVQALDSYKLMSQKTESLYYVLKNLLP